MTIKNAKTVLFVFLITAMVLPFSAINPVDAKIGQLDDIPQDYTLQQINHAFEAMEPYVIYDENKNIKFDIIATKDSNVTQLDIDIALDFAKHNDAIMNATIGAVGKTDELNTDDTELKKALQELETGKFKDLFANSGSVGAVDEVKQMSYDFTNVPIVSAFGVSEVKVQNVRHSSSNSALACGGGWTNPHTWYVATIYPRNTAFDNYSAAKSWALFEGYHMVSIYATDHFLNDFARTDITAPHNCNSGEFREQAVMTVKSTGAKFNMQHDEPNPELLNYVWPKLWWGSYVHWWHVTDGGTK